MKKLSILLLLVMNTVSGFPDAMTSTNGSMLNFCGNINFFNKLKNNNSKHAFIDQYPLITNPTYEFVIKLGHAPEPLMDGEISWNNLAYNAFLEWNQHLHPFQFVITVGSVGEGAFGNRINEVYFTDKYPDGTPIPSNVAGYAFYSYRFQGGGRVLTETDILLSNSVKWDSYREPVYSDKTDFYRLMLHEIGHVIGLSHPDQAGQEVNAVMNSYYPTNAHLCLDDIQGAQALYPVPLGVKPPNGPLLELRGMAGKRINVFHSTDLIEWRFIDSVFNETTQTNIPVDVGADYGFFKAVEE